MGRPPSVRSGGDVVTIAASLSYLLAHPQVPALTVARPAALALLALVALFAVLGPRTGQPARRTLVLRTMACTLVVLALAGVGLSTAVPHDRLSLTAVVDRSQSIDADGRRWTQRYVDQVRAALAPDDEFAVVAFGGDVAVLQPPGPPQGVDLNAAPVAGGATDIGRALQTAIALFPADGERRVLLLTDGNETRGDARAELPRAQRAGVTIFAAAPPHTQRIDMAVDKLTMPPLVTDGSVFAVRLAVRNEGPPRTAELTLTIDGAVVGRQPVTLQSGLNAVEVPYRLAGVGSHRVRAELSGMADAIPGNNWREATLMVGGPLRVLLVGTGRSATLDRALERTDASVTRLAPPQAPASVDALTNYQCVILEDPTVRSLATGALPALQAYVRDHGGGLVLAGGGESFAAGGFSTTPLEALLPVTLEPQRPPRTERAPLGLVLLLDRSNSMGFHIQNRLERSDDQSKLAYAKRAALAVVSQLQDRDQVGVITFDSQAFDVARLRPVKDNRGPLLRDIPRLQPGGGTDFYEALERARRQLAAARLATKHIMLLTDGDTNRNAAEHQALIAGLAADSISVTTIRIGDDTINLNLLRELAVRTGGQFHHVENARRLPELLLRDTSDAVSRLPRGPDRIAVRIEGSSQPLQGFAESALPELAGYAYTRLRPGADLLAYVPEGKRKHPLLAAWQYGLGRVAVFTASPSGDAATWKSWNGFDKFWSQLVRWTAADHAAGDVALEVQREAGRTLLSLTAFDDVTDVGAVLARIFTPDQALDLPLMPIGPRQFRAILPPLPAGQYPITLTRRRGGRAVTQRTQFLTVPAPGDQAQDEFEASGPNRPVLAALAAATGGAVDAPPHAVTARQPGTRRLFHPLDWLFLPAAMLLFLTDVALYRLARERWS